MKLLQTAMILLVLFSTAPGFAAAPQIVGGWAIYSSTSHQGAQTLLQASSSERSTDSDGSPAAARIDVVCTQGHLAGIAVDSSLPITRRNTRQSGDVDVTQVSFSQEGAPARSESWAVLSHGKTITPYAQILQGRRTREWADRIATTNVLRLGFNNDAEEQPVTATFRTAGFKDALAAAGCSY